MKIGRGKWVAICAAALCLMAGLYWFVQTKKTTVDLTDAAITRVSVIAVELVDNIGSYHTDDEGEVEEFLGQLAALSFSHPVRAKEIGYPSSATLYHVYGHRADGTEIQFALTADGYLFRNNIRYRLNDGQQTALTALLDTTAAW